MPLSSHAFQLALDTLEKKTPEFKSGLSMLNTHIYLSEAIWRKEFQSIPNIEIAVCSSSYGQNHWKCTTFPHVINSSTEDDSILFSKVYVSQ